MTEDELKKFLDGEELTRRIDVKTLVMDLIIKHTEMDEILKIFYSRLSSIDIDYLQRFKYMQRK